MKHFGYLIVWIIVFPMSSWGQLSEIELMNLAYITETSYLPVGSEGDILFEGRHEFSYNFDELVLGEKMSVTCAVYNKNRQILRYYENISVTVFHYDEAGRLVEANIYENEKQHNDLFFLLEEGSNDLERLSKIVYNYNALGQIESLRRISKDGTSQEQAFAFDAKGRLSGIGGAKFAYNEANQLEYKYYAPCNIHWGEQEGTYYEGVKYVYRDGSLIQKAMLYKSTLRMNVKIPSKNIDESMPLSPELTNASWSVLRSGISMKVYAVKNPQWESKISENYEYEKQDHGKRILQKTYVPDRKEVDGRKLDAVSFCEYLHSDSIRKKQNELLEIERQKELEKKRLKQEQEQKRQREHNILMQELAQKRAEAYQKQKMDELRSLIYDNHNKLISLYTGTNDFAHGLGEQLNLDIPVRVKFKKPKLFTAYTSIIAELGSFDENTLRNVLIVQMNIELLRAEKTKAIENRLSQISEVEAKLVFLKDEAMKLRGK